MQGRAKYCGRLLQDLGELEKMNYLKGKVEDIRPSQFFLGSASSRLDSDASEEPLEFSLYRAVRKAYFKSIGLDKLEGGARPSLGTIKKVLLSIDNKGYECHIGYELFDRCLGMIEYHIERELFSRYLGRNDCNAYSDLVDIAYHFIGINLEYVFIDVLNLLFNSRLRFNDIKKIIDLFYCKGGNSKSETRWVKFKYVCEEIVGCDLLQYMSRSPGGMKYIRSILSLRILKDNKDFIKKYLNTAYTRGSERGKTFIHLLFDSLPDKSSVSLLGRILSSLDEGLIDDVMNTPPKKEDYSLGETNKEIFIKKYQQLLEKGEGYKLEYLYNILWPYIGESHDPDGAAAPGYSPIVFHPSVGSKRRAPGGGDEKVTKKAREEYVLPCLVM